MADKPNTHVWLTGDKTINVEMSPEDLNSALAVGGPLVQLQTGEDTYEYVNPAHVIRARDTTNVGPMAEVF